MPSNVAQLGDGANLLGLTSAATLQLVASQSAPETDASQRPVPQVRGPDPAVLARKQARDKEATASGNADA